jgi:hypothetical protein
MANETDDKYGIDNSYKPDSLVETRAIPLGDFKAFEAQEKANEEAREAMKTANPEYFDLLESLVEAGLKPAWPQPKK